MRYFFPRPCKLADPFWIDCGDARLGCHRRQVSDDPGAPTLVHFHGNGEVVEDYIGDFADRITALGVHLLLVEYRGYGMSTGRPQLGRMLADVETVLRSSGVSIENTILFGRSVGSLFAIRGIRLFPNAGGLVIESGIADPAERILLRVSPRELGTTEAAFRETIARELDHEKTLAAYRGPVLVLHTRHDGMIDVSHAERTHAWAAGPKRLRVFDRGNHNDILARNEEEYFAELSSFLSKKRQQSPIL